MIGPMLRLYHNHEWIKGTRFDHLTALCDSMAYDESLETLAFYAERGWVFAGAISLYRGKANLLVFKRPTEAAKVLP